MASFFPTRVSASPPSTRSLRATPRAASLDGLRDGALDLVFAVDMLNEGVDIPSIDTVLMLRPTESRILWLQQLGRGLRRAEGKPHLTVVDYIGNHRTFLSRPRALLGLGGSDQDLAQSLERLEAGKLDLPPGCEVTYDLEAVNVLRSLLRLAKRPEAETLRDWYREFRDRTGERPRAIEAFHEGYNPRAARRKYRSWLGLVSGEGDLSAEAASLYGGDTQARKFLEELETTPTTRSFKMVVLLAMLNADQLPGELDIDSLVSGFARLAERSARLREDVEVPLTETGALRAYLERNPVAAWAGGRGTSGAPLSPTKRVD